jgi:hypothetical protein
VLNDYSISLWRDQIEAIREMNGLISFIVHPDYLVEPRTRAVYVRLLEHLARLRAEGRSWFALPGEVNRWWRDRQQLALVREQGCWRIEGPGAERARLAFASLDGDRVVFTVQGEQGR